MVKQAGDIITLLLPLLLLLAIFTEVEVAVKSNGISNSSSVKLFGFGDSYVDTGNFLNSPSFKPPSGITFPGRPAGRFCDGRVLTDYIASFLEIQPPIPYRLTNFSDIQYGMNFAHGGTGIFKTLVDGPNMTTQIDLFEKLIKQEVYTQEDLESSIALVNAAGNDYATFEVTNGSMKDIPVFTASLINQMSLNLKRIHSLGVGKVAVGLVEPLGCLPMQSVASSYQTCIETSNMVSKNYSRMLLQTVQSLNQEIGKPVFVTLDLYNSFLSTIATMQKKRAENSALMNPLEPCCKGVTAKFSCGSVDEKGAKKYRLCEKPEQSFFWDIVHLSQNGWGSVLTQLQSSLRQLKQ